MAITVEAVYENGVLKPAEPLPRRHPAEFRRLATHRQDRP